MKLYLIILLFLWGVCTGAAGEDARGLTLVLRSEGGIPIEEAKSACSGYKQSQCCRNGKLIDDPYIATAAEVCRGYRTKYSRFGEVVPMMIKSEISLLFRQESYNLCLSLDYVQENDET